MKLDFSTVKTDSEDRSTDFNSMQGLLASFQADCAGMTWNEAKLYYSAKWRYKNGWNYIYTSNDYRGDEH
jgi:hypothetical protein